MSNDRRVGSNDPTDLVSIAVTASDVVMALEANRRGSTRAVLRITPPFSGRMRARLHVEGREGIYGDVSPIHVDPDRLVETDLPSYPEVDATADELRDGGSVSREEHREYHVESVSGWRSAVAEAIVDRVELRTATGRHEVAVTVLG
jgi:hypothetical protein